MIIELAKYRVLNGIDKAIKKEGLKITFLLRLCLVIPFMFSNYFLGVTSLKFNYLIITMCGIIPEILVWAYVGQTISNIKSLFDGSSTDKTFVYVLIVGFIVAGVIVAYVTNITKKILKE